MSPVNVTGSLVYANNTAVGSATAQATWAGDTNHTGNTGNGGFTIGQASSTVFFSNDTATTEIYTFPYTTLFRSQATGVGMSPVNVTSSLIYSNNTNAGAATANASWGGDADQKGKTRNCRHFIMPAAALGTENCTAGAPYTFTGLSPTPSTAQATG